MTSTTDRYLGGRIASLQRGHRQPAGHLACVAADSELDSGRCFPARSLRAFTRTRWLKPECPRMQRYEATRNREAREKAGRGWKVREARLFASTPPRQPDCLLLRASVVQRIDAIVADLLIEYRITAEWVDAIDVAECPDFPGFSAARGLASIAATKPTARAIWLTPRATTAQGPEAGQRYQALGRAVITATALAAEPFAVYI